jgi:hypothetical protein
LVVTTPRALPLRSKKSGPGLVVGGFAVADAVDRFALDERNFAGLSLTVQAGAGAVIASEANTVTAVRSMERGII